MGRKRGWYAMVGLTAWVVGILLTVRPASAIYLDNERTIFFAGLFYNQLRLRTEEPRGFNTPVGDWTLMQHRYFVDPQLRINVLPWLRNLPFGAVLEDAVQLEETTFFFNPRFEYDGVYDYGPDAYRDEIAPRLQRTNRFALYEIYGTLGFFHGRVNVKVGRQNLSWGETSSFRLLDRINPLDNRFGGNLVPLDERRLPLTMLRITLGLGDAPSWEIYNMALEGFIAPDKRLPAGSPGPTPLGVIGAPSPPGFPPTLRESLRALGRDRTSGNQLDRPDVNLGDSRMGVRLLWTWKDASFTLAHLSTYPDRATQSLQLNPQGDPIIKLRFPNIQVTGMTVAWPLPAPLSYTVFRSEVAGFFGEPFFIEEVNFALGKRLPKRDVVRGVIGLDHNQWIRVLNPTQTFSISGQFFYSNIQGSMQGIKTPLQSKPGRYLDVDRENFLNTLTINTNYSASYFLNLAQLSPQLSFQYDWEGAGLIQPSLQFIRNQWRFRIEYNWIEGRFIGIGLLQDKDNLAFRIDYLI